MAKSTRPSPRTALLAITLTAGGVGLVVLFVGGVVVPLWHTHRVLTRQARATFSEVDLVREFGGPDQTATRLTHYLSVPRWVLLDRTRAVLVLGYCGSEALPAIEQVLRDKYEEVQVRQAAAWSVARAGPERLYLADIALNDASAEVRQSVTSALGHVDTEGVLPYLVRALNDSDPGVRYRALIGIDGLETDTRECLPAIERLLKDPDSRIRETASEVSQDMRRRAERDRSGQGY